MISYTYVNNQAKFIETRLISQINSAIFGRNESNFREKKLSFSGH